MRLFTYFQSIFYYNNFNGFWECLWINYKNITFLNYDENVINEPNTLILYCCNVILLITFFFFFWTLLITDYNNVTLQWNVVSSEPYPPNCGPRLSHGCKLMRLIHSAKMKEIKMWEFSLCIGHITVNLWTSKCKVVGFSPG